MANKMVWGLFFAYLLLAIAAVGAQRWSTFPASHTIVAASPSVEANISLPIASSTLTLKLKFDDEPTTELPVPMPGVWGAVVVGACAVIGFMLISNFGKRRSRFWGAVFFAFTLLTLLPNEWCRALGILVALAVAIGWLHFAFLKHFHTQGVLLGALLAVMSYVSAFAGVLASHRQLSVAEQMSAAMYEAAQLLILNMGVHDELNVPIAARWYFGFARATASALALVFAYKTVLFISARAGTRIHLNIDRLKLGQGSQLQLVIGLGKVGSQLAQNLANRGDRVIAIENNESNPCWKHPPEGKVRTLQADASLAETYVQLPFDAINNIFVTAGDDQRNVEIAQVVNEYSRSRVHNANLRDENRTWLSPFSRWFRKKFLANHQSKCHVQLYEANMRRILDQTLHGQEVTKTDVELRPFNAQEMAVRDLIQFEFTDSEIRPKAENEVALYIIVGFESLGQELALGIAQLAHFENLRRSRVLVLSRDPEEEIASFCARYPKFAKNSKETLSETTHITKLNELAFVAADDHWDAYSDQQPENQCGVDFTVNAEFAKLPPSPSDYQLLEAIKRLTVSKPNLVVKPVVIVCDTEWQRGLAWASEFTESWKQFYLREQFRSEGGESRLPTFMPTYFWLQGHNAIPRMLAKQQDLRPFGISDDLLTEGAIAGTVWRQVAAVVQRSYNLSVANPDKPVDKSTRLELMSYSDTQSNLIAALHSVIKFRIAEQSIEWLRGFTAKKLQPIEAKPELELGSRRFKLVSGASANWDPLIESLAKAEHNRWMAEQLLAGREWIIREPNKDQHGKKIRDRKPEERHLRDTLCAWRYLQLEEKKKDLLQAYYVLYHLKQLDS